MSARRRFHAVDAACALGDNYWEAGTPERIGLRSDFLFGDLGGRLARRFGPLRSVLPLSQYQESALAKAAGDKVKLG